MQRFILVFVSACTALGCLASLAFANGLNLPVFSSQMICDTDGADPFTDTKGFVTIFDDGDLLINIPGLRPNKDYRVVLGCLVGSKLVFQDRATSSRGRLLTVIPGLGRSDGLASGCAFPTVNLFPPAGGPEFCYTGYGQP